MDRCRLPFAAFVEFTDTIGASFRSLVGILPPFAKMLAPSDRYPYTTRSGQLATVWTFRIQ